MSFNHRYLWSTAFVTSSLRNERLSETATFCYFLAIMAFDWLQFTLIATTPNTSISLWSTVGSWSTFAVTVLGLVYLYRMNGGSNGRKFLQRYFPLSVTVGWKFVVAMFVALWLIPRVLAGQNHETLGWSATVSFTVINILMFWRIGAHLRSLSDEPSV
ncbi:hypothetical protein AVME950_20770 [Acidovorax sp. SUPP950]|uniref:hypothetical protein n=1 Tax=Acidovorax sp. SUPP950 TaxID=511901 RepID=UPI0023CED481|nr:hypothetical protein [Acidovorax sp. SUPP950]GKS77372.1 hypothetical protein AVME950_20770 [Acidovorax sp. SUPP950]